MLRCRPSRRRVGPPNLPHTTPVRNEPHFRARSRRSISGGSGCADERATGARGCYAYGQARGAGVVCDFISTIVPDPDSVRPTGETTPSGTGTVRNDPA